MNTHSGAGLSRELFMVFVARKFTVGLVFVPGMDFNRLQNSMVLNNSSKVKTIFFSYSFNYLLYVIIHITTYYNIIIIYITYYDMLVLLHVITFFVR